MHAFLMVRDDDVTQESGSVVAEGCIFSDGRVAIRWLIPGSPSSTVTWDSIDDAMLIHNHNGLTHLAIAADIPWPPGHMYPHDHHWRSLVLGTDGPWFCTDCGTYERYRPAEVGVDG